METTIQEMNETAMVIAALRAKEADASQAKKAISDELELAELRMLDMLEKNNMKSYKSPYGTVGVTVRSSVKTPKTPEDREAFFNYLKSIGLYDTMISVNSTTLNSFYKSKLKEAQETGIDFDIPGINEVTLDKVISFRK